MNELIIVFSDRSNKNKNYIQPQLTNILGIDSQADVWDEKVIGAAQKYGSVVAFANRNMKYYKVFYPNQLDVEIVKQYLDCFVSDHLYGDERCKFKLTSFAIDMIDAMTPIDECKTKLDLARKIHCKFLNNIPMLTEDGKRIIQEYHTTSCYKYYDQCKCEQPTENNYIQTEQSEKIHSKTCKAMYLCNCEELLQIEVNN